MTESNTSLPTKIVAVSSDIDVELRAMALRTGVSESEIIIGFIRDGLDACNRRGVVAYGALMASLEAVRNGEGS